MFTGMVSWIADVSAAIVAIPFKMFQGLIDMAEMFRLIDTDIEVKDKPGAPALRVSEAICRTSRP